MTKLAYSMIVLLAWTSSVHAQETPVTKAQATPQLKAQENPAAAELEMIKDSIGVWDAEIQVWAEGLDKPPVKFKGVETNTAYGDHWLASNFDSEVGGQTMRVHSIVGYDLDKKMLVGTVIDYGPYHAKMEGTYDKATKTVSWVTKAKTVAGNPLIQRTTVTTKSPTERVLVLTVPGEKENEFNKFMEIRFTKRK